MSRIDRIVTENVTLNSEEMTLLRDCLSEVTESAPSDAYIRVVIVREGPHLKGAIKIRSAAGVFDVEAQAKDLGSLIASLNAHAKENIRAWSMKRFAEEE